MGTVSASQDEAGFRRAFDQHYRDILAYAKRRSPIADAEDVAAETFATAWRRWASAPLMQFVRGCLASPARW